MDQKTIGNLADDYKRLVRHRTGLSPRELVCPREQSEMTPCVARDGNLAAADDGHCIGCGVYLEALVRKELALHSPEEQDPLTQKYEGQLTYGITPE